MLPEAIIAFLIPIVLIALPVWLYSRKSKRYGGHTDRIRVRVSPVIRTGFNKHPEDNLYTDDGRINRDWKP